MRTISPFLKIDPSTVPRAAIQQISRAQEQAFYLAASAARLDSDNPMFGIMNWAHAYFHENEDPKKSELQWLHTEKARLGPSDAQRAYIEKADVVAVYLSTRTMGHADKHALSLLFYPRAKLYTVLNPWGAGGSEEVLRNIADEVASHEDVVHPLLRLCKPFALSSGHAWVEDVQDTLEDPKPAPEKPAAEVAPASERGALEEALVEAGPTATKVEVGFEGLCVSITSLAVWLSVRLSFPHPLLLIGAVIELIARKRVDRAALMVSFMGFLAKRALIMADDSRVNPKGPEAAVLATLRTRISEPLEEAAAESAAGGTPSLGPSAAELGGGKRKGQNAPRTSKSPRKHSPARATRSPLKRKARSPAKHKRSPARAQKNRL